MDLTNIIQFIPENLLILITSIYVLGIFLKKTESVKDKYITVLLMAFSVLFSVLLNFVNLESETALNIIVNAILQGILCWGVAVGINQTTKQLSKEK